jgi:nitrite reductase/ring-hydroxylating ferredoxin subunit
MPWTTLCELSELVEGRGLYVDIGGWQLAVFLHEGRPYVMENTCPHAGGSLAGGHVEVMGGVACAVCPVHGWPFRLEDGGYYDMPGFEAKVFPVRVIEHEGRRMVQADLPMP